MVTDSNTAVVQFASSPTGAVVLVDGQLPLYGDSV